MVKKFSKLGLNTGGTVRFGLQMTRYQQHAKNQRLVYKSMSDRSSPVSRMFDDALSYADGHLKEYLEDGNISLDFKSSQRSSSGYSCSVAHSLNKHGRWRLPTLIKQAIDEIQGEDVFSDSKAERYLIQGTPSLKYNKKKLGLSLIEMISDGLDDELYQSNTLYGRTTTIYTPDCTGYHDSAMNGGHFLPRKQYSCFRDLQRKAEIKNTNEKRQKKSNGCQKKRKKLRNVHWGRGNLRRPAIPRYILEQEAEQDENRMNGTRDVIDEPSKVSYHVYEPRPLTNHWRYNGGISTERYDWTAKEGIWNQQKAFCKTKHRNSHRFYGNMDKREFIWEHNKTSSQGNDYVYSDNCQDIATPYSEEQNNTDRFVITENTNSTRPPIYCNIMDYAVSSTKIKKCKKSRDKHKHRHPNSILPADTPWCGRKSYQIIPDPESIVNEDVNLSHVDEQWSSKSNSRTFIDVITELQQDPSVQCDLLTSEIDKCHLLRSHKDDIYFGDSIPLKFAIDITSKIHKPENNWKKYYLMARIVNACSNSEVNGFVTVKITVAGPLELHHRDNVSNMLKSMYSDKSNCHTTLDSLITSVTNCVNGKTGPESYSPDTNDNSMQNTRAASMFRNLNPILKWKTKLYPQNTIYVTLNKKLTMARDKVTVSMMTSETSDYVMHCGVCYEPRSMIQTEGYVMGSSLTACNHWFCDECWLYHLCEKIINGTIKLLCPGHKCDSEITFIDLISLVPYSMYLKHQKHVMDFMIESSPCMKWCPKSSCEQVVCIESGRPQDVFVECVCGHNWCYTCQEPPHWPANCKQAAEFKNKIEKRANGYIFNVEAKPCPECSYPIQKNGGCNSMICSRCNTTFCWLCLRLWSEHSNYSQCPTKPAQFTAFGLYESVGGRVRAYYQGMSFKYHMLRCQSVHSSSTRRQKALAVKICRLRNSKQFNNIGAPFLDHSGNVVDISGGDNLLRRAALFRKEVYFILEHACIMLSSYNAKNIHSTLSTSIENLSSIDDEIKIILAQKPENCSAFMHGNLKYHLEMGQDELVKVIHLVNCVSNTFKQRAA